MTVLKVIEEISRAVGIDMKAASELYTERLYETGEAEAFLKGLAWLKQHSYILTGRDAELVRESIEIDAIYINSGIQNDCKLGRCCS